MEIHYLFMRVEKLLQSICKSGGRLEFDLYDFERLGLPPMCNRAFRFAIFRKFFNIKYINNMKVTVIFRGATGSGRNFKYEIKDYKPAMDAELKKEGIELNTNLKDNFGYAGFISSTHLYLTPKVGAEHEVELKAFKAPDRDFATIYFADIDKEAQKRFVNRLLVDREVDSIVDIESALEKKGSSLDVEKFEKIRMLRLQQQKLQKEIALIADL